MGTKRAAKYERNITPGSQEKHDYQRPIGEEMKILAGYFGLSFVILILVCGAAQAVAGEVMVDTVVAVVNETSITMGEVQQLANAVMKANPPTAGRTESDRAMYFFKLACDDIIKQRLILDEASKIGMIIRDREVEQAIERDVIKGGYKDLAEMLNELEVDKNTYFDKKKDEILYRRTISAKLLPRLYVSPKEISDYYNDNVKDYEQPEQVQLFGITFFKEADPFKNDKVLETVKQVLEKLREGADFSEMAKQFSQDTEHGEKGGDWGWVDREGNVAAAAAFDLPINTVSDIIEVGSTYWIVKVIARKQAGTTPLRQVWGEIRENLRQVKFERLRKEWLEELIQEAEIVFPLEVEEERPE